MDSDAFVRKPGMPLISDVVRGLLDDASFAALMAEMGAIPADTLHANSILYAVADHTPIQLLLLANQFAARGSTGNIVAKSITDLALSLLDDTDQATMLATMGAQAAANGAALPTGGSIVTGQIFRLTANDATAKAPPGLYKHDGTGWACIDCTSPYALGNLGAAPTLAAIPGVRYTATQDQNITTAPAITFSRPGIICITKTGAFTVIGKPTMAGRTSKELMTDAWTPSAGALSVWVIQDDGTYLISSASTAV